MSSFESQALQISAPGGWLSPYAAVALDAAPKLQSAADSSTLGFGGGTKLKLSPHADLGTEVLLFPGSRSDGTNSSDVRVLTSLQIRF